MATATTEKLENLLQCPICLERITQPKAFECLHFFCQKCIDDLKPKRDGYECPSCRQITAKEKLRHIHFIHELLEIVTLAKQDQQACETCKDAAAEWRCLDCKEIFCSGCKRGHDRFSLFKHHKWAPIQDGGQVVIDKHIFCVRHPEKHVELHCKQCKLLICMLCRGTDHHSHEAETIQDALNHIMPSVQQNTEQIQKRIKANEEVKANMSASLTEVADAYKKTEKEIDDKREEIVRKIDKERAFLKQQLASAKDKQVGEIKQGINVLDLRLKTEKNILALSNATLTTAHGTSLLQALQGGVNDSLVSYLATESAFPKFERKPVAQFYPVPISQDITIGSIREEQKVRRCEISMGISRPLTEIAKQNIKLIKTIKTGFMCCRCSKVSENLWCVEYDTNKIHVFSLDGTKLKTIVLNNLNNCRAAIQAGGGVAVASAKGLYLTDENGQKNHKIVNGDFCDVSSNGDKMFGLNNGHSKVCILKHDQATDTYINDREFPIDNYNDGPCNTIQATQEHIYIVQEDAHNILQYSHDGTLVATYGSFGRAVGQLKYPRLCGVDPHDTLLVADQCNQRLLTLTKNGEFQCLNVDNLKYPYCAVVEGNTLHIAGTDCDYTYAQYSLQ